jgi:predicted nucleic acid-binding protein
MGAAAKISISLRREDLAWARERAKRDLKSLSSVIADALRRQRQAEARGRLLAELGTDDISERERDEVRGEWRKGHPSAPRRRVQPRTSMLALTFDTGALIALERGDKRMRTVLDTANVDGVSITVPAVVVAEWWCGRSSRRLNILDGLDVEATTESIARTAGEAIAALPGVTVVDAIVMASAAQRGGIVYTSDVSDLERLRSRFPEVRVLRA